MIEENEDLYSLEIEIDGEVIEDLGLDVISIVDSPAVQIDFEYFSEEDKHEVTECDGECGVNHSMDSETFNQLQDTLLGFAESDEYGLYLTPEDVIIDLKKTQFGAVDDILQAIRGLNILKKFSVKKDEPAEVYWRYTGPSPERRFCKAMMRLASSGKIFSTDEIKKMSKKSWTPRMGPEGAATYNLFKFCGGVNCKHYWSKLLVFKKDNGGKVVIAGNPETFDEELAMSSQNTNSPSPWGAISNNARYGFSENYEFSMDDEKREVVGVVMLPGKKIIRKDENGEIFNIIFTEDTIRKMSEKYMRDKNINNTDINHDGKISTENTLLESWIVEDEVYDKSRKYGFKVPVGSWLIKMKINQDKVWEQIKSGELRGFSLAGAFVKKLIQTKSAEHKFNEIVKILEQVEIPDEQ